MVPLSAVQRLVQRWPRLTLIAGLLPLALPAAPDSKEYAIKAAYLFHFTQFVEWPDAALPSEGGPVRIGVVPPDPFGRLLEETVRDQQVHERPVRIVEITDPAEAADCQIVFIPRAAGPAARQLIGSLKGKPVLLVGEDPSFLQAGGMIALVAEEDRVTIVIHRAALETAALNASARLLRLARLVEVPPDP